MSKVESGTIEQLVLELPPDVKRALKVRAAAEGVHSRDLVVAWVRSWPPLALGRKGGGV